ncbi:hypothetical protein L596_024310 [Steinernema carpocapsae]|uniref:Uncharacterized protein n=1 Tax=Steinernema carpocapsae TaxID=34508 RepID=A0A4U5MH34_STECR|nr:hypothetical protein L596_024310 [Steinernema carpocapsae]
MPDFESEGDIALRLLSESDRSPHPLCSFGTSYCKLAEVYRRRSCSARSRDSGFGVSGQSLNGSPLSSSSARFASCGRQRSGYFGGNRGGALRNANAKLADDPNEDDSCLAQLKKIADCLRFKNGPHFQTLTNTNSPRGTLRPEEQQENETASMKMRNSQRKRIRKYVYIAQAALIAIVLGVYIGWRIIDYSRGSSMAPNATDSDSILTPTLATVFLRPLDDRNSTFNATDEVPSVIPSLAPSLNTIESNEEEHRKTSSNRKMISAVAAKKHSDNLVEFADSP